MTFALRARLGAWQERWIEKNPSFYRQVVLVGLPVAFQQAINIGVNLMDTVMVGALGENALSASSLANQYYYLYYILCLGISGGACVLSAQYWGAGNKAMVRQVWRLSMYIAGGSAILFAVVTGTLPHAIMGVYTTQPEMIELGSQYLRVTAWIFFFHGTSLIMVNLLRTVGVLYLGLIVSSLSFFTNIFFNYVFIFGKFGAPRLGIAGAAVGTLISRGLEFAITFGYLLGVQKYIAFRPKDFAGKLDPAMMRSFLTTGMPPIISDGMYTVGDNILSVILGRCGQRSGHHLGYHAVLYRLFDGAEQRLLGDDRAGGGPRRAGRRPTAKPDLLSALGRRWFGGRCADRTGQPLCGWAV